MDCVSSVLRSSCGLGAAEAGGGGGGGGGEGGGGWMGGLDGGWGMGWDVRMRGTEGIAREDIGDARVRGFTGPVGGEGGCDLFPPGLKILLAPPSPPLCSVAPVARPTFAVCICTFLGCLAPATDGDGKDRGGRGPTPLILAFAFALTVDTTTTREEGEGAVRDAAAAAAA
ncbi:hypothetical protein BDZ97DRAFT_1870811 [Flammula alnicola]|nr:hypothetical protein BDZ97DRAFT_1870811 [Flammula alnicola]